MMAGATTKASTAIGAVTEAQMARIFVNEYCSELAGASSCAGSDCVLVMPSASARIAGLVTSPGGLEIAAPEYASRVTPAVRLQGDVWPH